MQTVVGIADRKWRPKTKKQQILEQIAREDEVVWARGEDPVTVQEYQPQPFQLSETAKHVFASSIHFIRAIPKL